MQWMRTRSVLGEVMYTLIEPCSGSATLSFHLLGAKRPLLPYQGSKWRFRKALQAHAESLGFEGPPSRLVLTDPGPWGKALAVVLDRALLPKLIDALSDLEALDPLQVFQGLNDNAPSAAPVRFAAEFLFLQRLAFSGKAVGIKNGRWSSPGFNRTSAYGVPKTDSFGAIGPMIPSLIRVLVDYQTDLHPVEATVECRRAEPPVFVEENTLVYLDPPYAETTPYPGGDMSRVEVIELANAYRSAGAAVIISEQCQLDLATWSRHQLDGGRQDRSPFRGKQQEWVTISSPRRQS